MMNLMFIPSLSLPSPCFKLDGRPLTFINAYSAEQAKELLNQERDIAIAFIDVVMESDHAGLELVKWIREELQNKTTMINSAHRPTWSST